MDDRQQKRLDRLFTTLENTWDDFRASYAGLSDEEMLIPGIVGEWSARDLIAHVTIWEEETLEVLPLILSGGTPPKYSQQYGGIDAFNRQKTEERCHLSLDEVREESEAVHRRLIAWLRSLPPDQLLDNPRFRRRLCLDTYGHYPEHAAAVREWRTARQSGSVS